MSIASLLALLPLATDPAHAALDRLVGCWDAPGEVMGKQVAGRARAAWRLGGRYLLFEWHGLDPADPYDAAIILGAHDRTRLRSSWMDSFGAGNGASGQGTVAGGAIAVDYGYPDADYANRWTPVGTGWQWTIVERKPAGETPFAAYRLTPVACDDTKFAF